MTDAEMLGRLIEAAVVLIGLFLTVAKPMLENQKSVTKLTDAMDNLSERLVSIESNNTDAHKRIWDKNTEQDKQIIDHETRISILEHK